MHHAVYTHALGVSVVVGRTKVSIPMKRPFLGNESSDRVVQLHPIGYEVIFLVLHLL